MKVLVTVELTIDCKSVDEAEKIIQEMDYSFSYIADNYDKIVSEEITHCEHKTI